MKVDSVYSRMILLKNMYLHKNKEWKDGNIKKYVSAAAYFKKKQRDDKGYYRHTKMRKIIFIV